MRNDKLGCSGWKRTSTAPWGNKVSVTWHLLTKGILQLCSQQWYRFYYRYLWALKMRRQLFLLMCLMSSYDRFKCKNVFIWYVGPCYSIIWPSFRLLHKIWAICAPPLPSGTKISKPSWLLRCHRWPSNHVPPSLCFSIFYIFMRRMAPL